MNHSLGARYQALRAEIAELAVKNGRAPEEIALIVVSKTRPLEALQEIYEAGCRDMGENRLQEAFPKIEQGPPDMRWHLIGTLQSNKVRKAVGRFTLIHSVDTLALAEKIAQVSAEIGVTSRILLQVNTSGELSKHGLSVEEWRDKVGKVLALPCLKVEGLMTMAPLTEEEGVIRKSFAKLRLFRDELGLRHLSMGMSHDYRLAVSEGATLLRIGSALFD